MKKILLLIDDFSYLGAFMGVDWTAFLRWIYDKRIEYEYPFNSQDMPYKIASPPLGEVRNN